MKQLLVILFILLLPGACSKDNNNDPGDPGQPFIFSSLTAEKDTIESGESVKIFAVATGYKLNYYWMASAGDILGSGSEILYAASPCHAGKNKVTCTVRDGNNASRSREVYIVVK